MMMTRHKLAEAESYFFQELWQVLSCGKKGRELGGYAPADGCIGVLTGNHQSLQEAAVLGKAPHTNT